MSRHILAPVPGSRTIGDGLRFPAQFLMNKEDVRFTLFHAGAAPRLRPSDAATRGEYAGVLRQEPEVRKKTDAVMEAAKLFLTDSGFKGDHVFVKSVRSRFGPAGDIADEGFKGRYDAISLGHGGFTPLDALFRRSVSRSLVETPLSSPLWISRWPACGAKHVLVCADGSPESVRAADHAGFILADEPEHEIHILHIYDPAKEDRQDAEDALDMALIAVIDNGFPRDRIRTFQKRGAGIARMIREAVLQGGYAAVAVGRSGAGSPWGRGFFSGSVTRALFRDLEGCSLWIAP